MRRLIFCFAVALAAFSSVAVLRAAFATAHQSATANAGDLAQFDTERAAQKHCPRDDHETITKSPILRKDLPSGNTTTISTTTAQDAAMMSRANALYSSQGNRRYNALTNNCDQFVSNVLSKGDPVAAENLKLVPNSDMPQLKQYEGLVQASH